MEIGGWWICQVYVSRLVVVHGKDHVIITIYILVQHKIKKLQWYQFTASIRITINNCSSSKILHTKTNLNSNNILFQNIIVITTVTVK
jgi:hypothetical protein